MNEVPRSVIGEAMLVAIRLSHPKEIPHLVRAIEGAVASRVSLFAQVPEGIVQPPAVCAVRVGELYGAMLAVVVKKKNIAPLVGNFTQVLPLVLVSACVAVRIAPLGHAFLLVILPGIGCSLRGGDIQQVPLCIVFVSATLSILVLNAGYIPQVVVGVFPTTALGVDRHNQFLVFVVLL